MTAIRELSHIGPRNVRPLRAMDQAAREDLARNYADLQRLGIHVDDVALVVHADPPVEHKAYLHRSGRTARAGHCGTVVTLVSPDQHDEVKQMMRKAGIRPTVAVADRQVLAEVAPGERIVLSPDEARALAQPAASAAQRARSGSSRPRGSAQSSRKRARG